MSRIGKNMRIFRKTQLRLIKTSLGLIKTSLGILNILVKNLVRLMTVVGYIKIYLDPLFQVS